MAPNEYLSCNDMFNKHINDFTSISLVMSSLHHSSSSLLGKA